MNYEKKYLKYKNKYISLKNQLGGAFKLSDCPKKSCSSDPRSLDYRYSIHPDVFLALESDNPGLFDKNNDIYYENVNKIRGTNDEYTVRAYKMILNLVITDEKGNKSRKDVKPESSHPDNKFLIVTTNHSLQNI